MKIFKKLNSHGVAHHLAMVVVVMAVAIGGTAYLIASHADTPTLTPVQIGDLRSLCTFVQSAVPSVTVPDSVTNSCLTGLEAQLIAAVGSNITSASSAMQNDNSIACSAVSSWLESSDPQTYSLYEPALAVDEPACASAATDMDVAAAQPPSTSPPTYVCPDNLSSQGGNSSTCSGPPKATIKPTPTTTPTVTPTPSPKSTPTPIDSSCAHPDLAKQGGGSNTPAPCPTTSPTAPPTSTSTSTASPSPTGGCTDKVEPGGSHLISCHPATSSSPTATPPPSHQPISTPAPHCNPNVQVSGKCASCVSGYYLSGANKNGITCAKNPVCVIKGQTAKNGKCTCPQGQGAFKLTCISPKPCPFAHSFRFILDKCVWF